MATALSVEVPARAVRKHLRKARRASVAARPVTEVLQDLYIGLFLVSAMVAPLARKALKDVVAHGGAGHVPHALVPDLGLALALVAAGTGLRALQLIGPVVCD